jgi:hypothetical protein
VISELERVAAGPLERAELRRQLRAGPWCWPPDLDRRRMQWAEAIAGTSPPAMAPGCALGVTLFDRTTCVWRIEIGTGGPEDTNKTPVAELGAAAKRAWQHAALALPRALPVLWTSVGHAAAEAPRLVHIASADGRGFERVVAVDGPSFGLTFVAVLASHVLGIALPEDIAASATVLPDGSVGDVRGIEEKIDGLIRLAPRVRRLLVAAGQYADASGYAAARRGGTPFEIVPVTSAAEGLQVAFGGRLAAGLVATADPAQRGEIVGSLFRLAFAGRRSAIDWTPIEAAAALALKWDGLDDDQRYRLEFARAVAARHERNAGVLPIPSPAWLARQPRPIQVGVATHMLQQSADAGVPDAATAEETARPYLPADERSAFQSQLRMLGALARLWAVTGRPREALDLQERIARAFFDAFEYSDLSFQFSEWFRLSGALADRGSFDRAEELYRHMLTLGAFGLDGSVYVDLARARGMVMLGAAQADDVAALFERLATSAEVPEHVRWSAARWGIQAHLQAAAPERAQTLRARLDRAAREQPNGSPAKHAALAALDTCVRSGRDPLAPLAQLQAIEPGVVGHLRRAAPADHEAAYLTTFYPY